MTQWLRRARLKSGSAGLVAALMLSWTIAGAQKSRAGAPSDIALAEPGVFTGMRGGRLRRELQGQRRSLGPKRTRLPSGRLRLGTDLDGIVQATEQCSRDAARACTVESFADELSSNELVSVDSLWMDVREVSVAQYERCVSASRCRPAAYPGTALNWKQPNWPVVYVTQDQARAYCAFARGRLPTETEWEWAAGAGQRRYAWGRIRHGSRFNFGSDRPPFSDASDGTELLAPVDAYVDGATPLGLLQMSGNAAEWTDTPYGAHDTPMGARQRGIVVVKGGSFREAPVHHRVTARRPQRRGIASVDVGFRCVSASRTGEAPRPKRAAFSFRREPL